MDPRKALMLWLGTQVMGDDLDELKAHFRGVVGSDPIGSMASTVFLGGLLFYEAEREHNPKVSSLSDALVFVSSCVSGGYSEIFAKTEKGKLIATALQTVGPAMSSKALEAPRAPPGSETTRGQVELLETQKQLVGKLDAILSELKAQRAR
jgi:voltage-gated potassium channel